MQIDSIISHHLKIQNKEIAQVRQFNYHGSIIAPDGSTDADIDLKLGKARQIFGILNKM